ncbi:MAG: thrombospondin type 3 repeat-containing protein [Candidatus Zixiibacteriota bacterium]
MKRAFIIFIAILCLQFALFSVETNGVKQKVSIGAGTGLFKNLTESDYTNIGNEFGGHIKYGVSKSVEIGVNGYFGYNYVADVININLWEETSPGDSGWVHHGVDEFPWLIRHPEHGEYDRSFDKRGLDPYDYTNKAKTTFDRMEDPQVRYQYLPIELYIQFRSMYQSAFNPFLTLGLGYYMWSVNDINDGEVVEVWDSHDDSWKDFSGNHFMGSFGLGMEVFPVPQVGIDVGAYGVVPFMDEFAQYVTDTVRLRVDARAHITFYYGGIRDSDRDGVYDNFDECPDTPLGATVDEVGCPVDSDQDGVYDGLDQCPKTPFNATVDAKGCPTDSDGDGVYDGIDKCTNTPSGAKVDEQGCAIDSDEDGVPDHKDACPGTPKGATVNVNGCPLDSDGDGVYDGIDKCPNTASGTQVNQFGCPLAEADADGDGIGDEEDKCPNTPKGATVDERGCPVDSDDDGVYDHNDDCPRTPQGARVDSRGCPKDRDDDGVYDGIDECPNTQKGAVVDSKGCAKDSDGDGVPDGIDKCQRTPAKAYVDEFGCPKDTDGDGVFDGIDKCPNTKEGEDVDSLGCRKLEKGQSIAVRVHFESCKWDITPKAEDDLQEAYEILKAHPEMHVAIEGHTDDQQPTGTCEEKVGDNMGLSRLRARAVYDWLVRQGIDEKQLKVEAYGETKPVSSNDTKEGRANNRRIEFRRLK